MARWSWSKSMKKQVYLNSSCASLLYNYGVFALFGSIKRRHTTQYKNRSQNRGIFVFTERKGSRFFGYFFVFLWASGQTESDRATRSERAKKQKKQICLRRLFDLTKWQKSCWKSNCQPVWAISWVEEYCVRFVNLSTVSRNCSKSKINEQSSSFWYLVDFQWKFQNIDSCSFFDLSHRCYFTELSPCLSWMTIEALFQSFTLEINLTLTLTLTFLEKNNNGVIYDKMTKTCQIMMPVNFYVFSTK